MARINRYEVFDNNDILEVIDTHDSNSPLCECYTQADAQKIADALNMVENLDHEYKKVRNATTL